MKISAIFEKEHIMPYLESRNLLKQYQKAKNYLLLGYLKQVNFKLRHPKEFGVYSFRKNRQFRAFCVCKENELIVFNIDNHQN